MNLYHFVGTHIDIYRITEIYVHIGVFYLKEGGTLSSVVPPSVCQYQVDPYLAVKSELGRPN